MVASELTGQRFGALSVIQRSENDKNGRSKWVCLCNCGVEISVIGKSLKSGNTTSCGCVGKARRRQKMQDLSGQVFGSLTVVRRNDGQKWDCRCVCGIDVSGVLASNLKSGNTASCGCSRVGAKAIDLTGQRFGRLLVTGRAETEKVGVHWECICDCGNTAEVLAGNLTTENTTSCGCRRREVSRALHVDMTATRFGKINITDWASAAPDGKQYWNCICDCGSVKVIVGGNLRRGNTRSCGCAKAIAQFEVRDFVKTLIGDETVESDLKTIIPPRQLDVVVPSRNFAIEYNGLHWHGQKWLEKSQKPKFLTYQKYLACQAAGYRLVTIFEDEWLTRREAVQGYLRSILGQKETLGARKCVVRIASQEDVLSFIEQHHIQGACRFKLGFALEYEGVIVAAATFSRANASKLRGSTDETWELTRYCVTPELSVSGGMSRLLNAFLKEMPSCRQIISYSDNRWSVGRIYEASGFVCEIPGAPSFWYFKDGRGTQRFHRFGYHRKTAVKKYGGSPEDTEWDIMSRNGWDRIWDCGKARWVYSVAG